MNISVKSTSHTVIFAAEELKKYLKMMFPDIHSEIDFGTGSGFVLGTFDEIGIKSDLEGDKMIDDIIFIDTKGDTGIISGNNPRAVLLAVYEYLRAEGCRFLFPGEDGEYIPIRESLADVSLSKKASRNIRGQCIEGGVSQQNVLNSIDFAPKVGMNAFMLECFSPYGYLNSWYTHRGTVGKTSEAITREEAIQMKRRFEAEIDKRGLLYNDMGHGFTTLAFGVDNDEDAKKFSDFEYLAKIGGKREFYKGGPIETNFCMSNHAARGKFVDFVVDYATKHFNVDMLHIWLADGINNHCECEECQKLTPSDFYVMLLNEIDEELTKRNIKTKLVFVVYCDLLWAPEKIKFKNPDRFVLLFAPITRDYNINYGIDADFSGVMPYERNKLENPKTMAENIAYLYKWRDSFSGPAFAYEYHFYFLPYFDLSGLSLADCASRDVKGLSANGITGIIEDQSQRNAFPNNLPIYVWARTMWDASYTLDELTDEYFSAAYGADAKHAYDYLKTFSETFPFEYMISKFKDKEELGNREILAALPRLAEMSEKIKEICKRNLAHRPRCQSVSFKLLLALADLTEYYIPFMKNVASFNIEGATARLDEMIAYLSDVEEGIQPYFDTFLFGLRMQVALKNRQSKIDFQ